MNDWRIVVLQPFFKSESSSIRAVGEALVECTICQESDCPGLDRCTYTQNIVERAQRRSPDGRDGAEGATMIEAGQLVEQ